MGRPSPFNLSRAGIGIDSDDEKIAFGARRLQIANVADVQQIEHAIGKNDFAACAAVLVEDVVQAIAGENFFARVHARV